MRHTYIAVALLLALAVGAALLYKPAAVAPRQELAELARLQSDVHNKAAGPAAPQDYLRARKKLIDESSTADLIALLRSDPDPAVRMSALQVLAGKGGPEALAALVAVHRDPAQDVSFRFAAVHGIDAIGDVAALIDILRSDCGGHLAAVALGRLKAAEAVPDLAHAISDADISLACHAAAALGAIGTSEARSALETSVTSNSTVRRAIERALLKESR